jgi:hypothetical protein
VYEVATHRNRVQRIKNKVFGAWARRKERKAEGLRVVEVARIAAAKARAKASVKAAVQTVSDDDVEMMEAAKPAIPAGKKALRVIN